jgi:hypothetical protein
LIVIVISIVSPAVTVPTVVVESTPDPLIFSWTFPEGVMTSLKRPVASTFVVSVDPTTETVMPVVPDVVEAKPTPDPLPTVPESVADAALATTGASGATGDEVMLLPQAVSDRATMTMNAEKNAGLRTESSCWIRGAVSS